MPANQSTVKREKTIVPINDNRMLNKNDSISFDNIHNGNNPTMLSDGTLLHLQQSYEIR